MRQKRTTKPWEAALAQEEEREKLLLPQVDPRLATAALLLAAAVVIMGAIRIALAV